MSKNLEDFLQVNDLMGLPVSEFIENVEKLRIEDYANFSIFHILDIIKILENSGYESHLNRLRAYTKELAKTITKKSD